MRLRQVRDVNIVADTRTIGRIIIVAEDFDVGPFALSDLQNERDQMAFGVVVLAAFQTGACRIKVTKCNITETFDPVQPVEVTFDHRLGFAVRTTRHNAFFLGDRHGFRIVKEIGGT